MSKNVWVFLWEFLWVFLIPHNTPKHNMTLVFHGIVLSFTHPTHKTRYVTSYIHGSLELTKCYTLIGVASQHVNEDASGTFRVQS